MNEVSGFRPTRILLPLGLFATVISTILGFWTWMGAPIALPTNLGSVSDKSFCVSYWPFRGTENPMTPGIEIPERRIDEDLQKLAGVTRCVRTYLADRGLQHVPALAARYGMKVQQGIWIGRDRTDNQKQIDAAVRLAKQHPSIISVIVGNEVLYSGAQDIPTLLETIRHVKRRVSVPVTYAELPPIWMDHPELAAAVDFITLHVLPYWDDYAAEQAVAYVDDVWQRMQHQYPGKRIVIGEVGWPSQGRMRGAAEASPANQARVIRDVIARAERTGLDVTILEAFDQPWKSGQEGGYWGMFDAQTREPKFAWSGPVSNHPQWKKQAAGGVLMAVLIFAIAFATRDKHLAVKPLLGRWAGVSIIAVAAGMTVALTFERIRIESFDAVAWSFSLALAAVALAAPLCAVPAVMRDRRIPAFAELFGGAPSAPRDPIEIACGIVLLLLSLLATIAALVLVWGPSYRNFFPAAAMTCAVVPFVVLALRSRLSEAAQIAEIAVAAILAVSAAFILHYERRMNWQTLWLALILLALSVTLARAALYWSAQVVGRSVAQAVRRRARS
jgi:glucan 1,3-beta-glucosidase